MKCGSALIEVGSWVVAVQWREGKQRCIPQWCSTPSGQEQVLRRAIQGCVPMSPQAGQEGSPQAGQEGEKGEVHAHCWGSGGGSRIPRKKCG